MLTKIFLIINLVCRKGVNDMAVVYATLIIKGVKKFADVPARIKEQVKHHQRC